MVYKLYNCINLILFFQTDVNIYEKEFNINPIYRNEQQVVISTASTNKFLLPPYREQKYFCNFFTLVDGYKKLNVAEPMKLPAFRKGLNELKQQFQRFYTCFKLSLNPFFK